MIYLEGIGVPRKIPTSLKKIELEGLKNLFWIGELPPKLETLSIFDCNTNELTMSSLPRNLNGLTVDGRMY
jgi:hypothetical protein